MKKQKINKAFTLAEILITLLIIGIVSSIVIPALINDTREAELNTALKKTYAELSQAHKYVVNDNGGTYKGLLWASYAHTDLKNIYATKLNYVKSCNNARTEGCWHPSSTNGGNWREYDGGSTDSNNIYGGLILANGAFVNFISQDNYCGGAYYYSKNAICALIVADVNGFKGPNRTGKDVFYFYMLEHSISPFGDKDCLYHTCAGSGLFCTASKLVQ